MIYIVMQRNLFLQNTTPLLATDDLDKALDVVDGLTDIEEILIRDGLSPKVYTYSVIEMEKR